jgi:hypothetical protein
MTGEDVVRDTHEVRPHVTPFLEPGEQLQVVLRGSSRPAMGVKLVMAEVWPFFRDRARFLLVATDRRWLVLESAKERHRGDLHVRGSFDRDIRVETSWLHRFDGFDQPYTIDPIYELWAKAANDALDARAAGRLWSLAECAGRLTASDDDQTVEALAPAVMKLGRFVPRRRGSTSGPGKD